MDPVTAYDDPIGAFHRYRYANNNSYKFTDPDGRCSTWGGFLPCPVPEALRDPALVRADEIRAHDGRMLLGAIGVSAAAGATVATGGTVAIAIGFEITAGEAAVGLGTAAKHPRVQKTAKDLLCAGLMLCGHNPATNKWETHPDHTHIVKTLKEISEATRKIPKTVAPHRTPPRPKPKVPPRKPELTDAVL